MAITVAISRHIRPGSEEMAQRALRSLRVGALHREGYQRGETLIDAEHGDHWLVLSTWDSMEDWAEWRASDERQRLEQDLGPLLTAPPEVAVFIQGAPSLRRT